MGSSWGGIDYLILPSGLILGWETFPMVSALYWKIVSPLKDPQMLLWYLSQELHPCTHIQSWCLPPTLHSCSTDTTASYPCKLTSSGLIWTLKQYMPLLGPLSQDHVVTRGSVSILNSGKLWASKVKALKLISLFPRLFYCLLFYVVSLRGWMYAVMWRPPSWENEGWMLCPQNRLDFLCEPHGAPAPVKILIRVCKALST